ncbi:MAG TPA: Omp28-related outer membrane protein [Bacteroidales bacterium]|nr:Omp28-related outer membrane protein [Bacteroidales bacterium]
MKKTLLTVVTLLAFATAFSQAVQRSNVILEIGTGTGCQYCPGAAMGAEDLLSNGAHVAVIEYHSYNSGDPFNTPEAAQRTSYYGITGYPTAYFDGTMNSVGGSNTTSMYPTYLPIYNTQYGVLSPLTIDISGYNTGNTYYITLTITKVATVSGTDLRAHLALTESDIAYSWQGQSEINHTERLMVPGSAGTTINFNSGNTVTLNLSFTKDPTWVTANCELVAFVQDNASKTIYNGAKKALNALALPLPTNFSGTPTGGCTPMTVQYTDLSTGATSWIWNFPGGTPSTSTLQNPTVVYNTAGTYDVSLNAFNIPGNQAGSMSKPAYISVNSAPVAPGIPSGISGLCVNPPDQTYFISAVANTTGYEWQIIPSTAATITNNGTTCVVNFDNAFVGIGQLKVRCANACGNSPWSPYLNITVSTEPAQAAAPTGPTSLCMNPGSVTYSTMGANNASTYQWDLQPPDAGALYPNGTSVSIAWSSTFTGTATLKVKGINNSCEGPWSSDLAITVSPGPTAYSLTGGGGYCATGGTGSPVGLSGSQTATSYTLYLNNVATTTVVPGTGSALSFGSQTVAGTYTAMAATTSGGCTNTMTGTAVVTVDPSVPATPAMPVGPTNIWSGSTPTTDYSTTGGTYATSYSWEVSPAAAGTITGNTTTGTATWNPTYTGPATVKVKSVNSCGSSTLSADFAITVSAGSVGMGEKSTGSLIGLYPNPATGMVTLVPVKDITADIHLYNSIGTEVFTRTAVNLTGNYPVDLSALKPGIYFFRISNAEYRQVMKLVVQ